ncbi:hypothetical protein SLH46_06785 [Draconibacterium sp. IB214405]|uniref:fluoroquinolone export ABC transporter permease subunit n=1 Tax=Draconibacterium sp. IB214405 TaxID=3097352 RepID=UPI002A104C38|nr:hypothetical protein [Draconibacterium sp. IB214405]MDX8338880.1 hypothetical protein [Draconibacterium sp. IB214405]
MNSFGSQLKWQFVLLQKNSIITISFAVTLTYGLLLYFLRDIGSLDKLLVALVLNDPSVIGYFFIALAIYIEMKHQILQAIFVTPFNLHHLFLSKVLSVSLIGMVCSLGLAFSVKGFDFNILLYAIGSFSICILSALLGLYMLTFSNEFLKFAMTSIPVFLAFVNLPLLQYLGVFEMGAVKYLFPIQGSLDLIDYAISGTDVNFIYAIVSIVVFIPLFYWLAFRRFSNKVVHQ